MDRPGQGAGAYLAEAAGSPQWVEEPDPPSRARRGSGVPSWSNARARRATAPMRSGAGARLAPLSRRRSSRSAPSSPTSRPPVRSSVCSRGCAPRPRWPREPPRTRMPPPPRPNGRIAPRPMPPMPQRQPGTARTMRGRRMPSVGRASSPACSGTTAAKDWATSDRQLFEALDRPSERGSGRPGRLMERGTACDRLRRPRPRPGKRIGLPSPPATPPRHRSRACGPLRRPHRRRRLFRQGPERRPASGTMAGHGGPPSARPRVRARHGGP